MPETATLIPNRGECKIHLPGSLEMMLQNPQQSRPYQDAEAAILNQNFKTLKYLGQKIERVIAKTHRSLDDLANTLVPTKLLGLLHLHSVAHARHRLTGVVAWRMWSCGAPALAAVMFNLSLLGRLSGGSTRWIC